MIEWSHLASNAMKTQKQMALTYESFLLALDRQFLHVHVRKRLP